VHLQSKINILQLGSTIGLYGAERWILALINHLDKDRIETWVGVINDESDTDALLCTQSEKLGFQTTVVQADGRWDFSAVKQLKCFILSKEIHILHTHGYKTDMIGLLATRGTPCKIITTLHGWTQKPDFKLLCYEVFDRLLFPFFDAVVPLSNELYRHALRIPGIKKKLHLIRNGVDIAEIDLAHDVAKEIDTWKKEGAFIIGYIGRLTSGKGLDTLFYALAHHGQANWRIAMIGEGEQLAELQSMAQRLCIEDRITFFGFRSDRLAFLKGFDVFVLPSRSEGIPRCLMEAMAARIPVVASNIPGCRYLVKNDITGLLFETGDAKQLASAIKKIDTSNSLRESFGKVGRNLIDSHYSASKMAREYLALYNSLAF
jgi:glycosyltransferase involved in cell wall biosynthesis